MPFYPQNVPQYRTPKSFHSRFTDLMSTAILSEEPYVFFLSSVLDVLLRSQFVVYVCVWGGGDKVGEFGEKCSNSGAFPR